MISNESERLKEMTLTVTQPERSKYCSKVRREILFSDLQFWS